MATNMSFNAIVHEVLTKDNYANWSACVKIYLVSEDLWDIFETEYKQGNEAKSKTWRKKNAKALHAIQISCGPDMLSQIREFSTAKAAWDFLSKMNKPRSQREFSEHEKPQSQEVSEIEQLRSQGESSPGDPFLHREVSEPKKQQSQKKRKMARIISQRGTDNRDYVQYLSLHKAVDSGDWKAVKEFLDHNPGAVRARIAVDGETALHAATVAGHEIIVKELVQLMEEKDLEIKTEDGSTALAFAARYTNNTQIAECIFKKNKKMVSVEAKNGIIPVVAAAGRGHGNVMLYLYSVTPLEELDPEKGDNGVRLLLRCITAKRFDVALDLLDHYPCLAVSLSHKGHSPVHILANTPSAFPSGTGLVSWQRLIYSCIREEPARGCNYVCIDIQKPHQGQNARGNIIKLAFGQLHGLLSNLLKFFGIKQIFEKKLMHDQVKELLRLFCDKIETLSVPQLEELKLPDAIFDAVRHGIVEFITEIIKANPIILPQVDGHGRNIFMLAITHRQEKIFNLIYAYDAYMGPLTSRIDRFHNSMVHLAGLLAPSTRLDLISGAALQMQRELQWFKEVERIVLPKLKETQNSDGERPREIFTKNHKKLVKAGEKWMKEMATSCTFVAALIVTITFAAAITIPGGFNGNTGFPLFLGKKLFMVFIVSDAISFFSSSTSVLIFLGILTSRYGEEYFLKSLPTKMIIGLTTLFISIATMMITFCSALSVTLQEQSSWILISTILLATVPITLFIWLQFPLLVEIFISTYGPGIFRRKTSFGTN